MAIPEKLDFNSSFWKDPKRKDSVIKFIDTPIAFPRMEFKRLPYNNRTYHKSPGSRTYTETVFNERTGYFMFHQGIEELRTVEFWQEVAMLTEKDATAKDMQRAMVHLTREQVYEGYVHYCDVWSWDDDSPKTRRLMEAFEAEHKDGPKVRLCEKVDFSVYIHDVQESIHKAFTVGADILNPSA